VRYDFGSDNTAGMAPAALQAVVDANDGYARAYGADDVTARAADQIRRRLDADAEIRFVFSGTAANAIALSMLAQPHEAVLAHHAAHVCTDETGAPGFFGHGLGLIGLPGFSGKIEPTALHAALDEPVVGHRQPAAALSLTQATEYGSIYSEDELRHLIEPAKLRGHGVHMDGARLANAAAAGFEVKAIAGLGVDILVVGGTKAGMPPTEAVVICDRTLARRFDSRLKQAGQLPSKGRFLAAPFVGMLEDGDLVRHAAHANAMARRLAGLSPFRITHPVEANGVFVEMDDERLAALQAAGWFVYRFLDGSVRFMCSWATTAETVDEFGEALRRVA